MLFAGESLNYMQDIVVNFRTIIQIKDVFCMQVYLDNALLMKERRT